MFPLVSSSRSFLKSIIATLVAVILLVQSSLPVSATLPVTVPEMAGTVEGAESSLPVLSLESEEEFGFSEETSGEIPDERLEEAPVSDEISEENPVEVPSETLAEPKEPDVPDVASEIPSESDTEPEVVESEDAESILIEREAVEVFEFEEEPVIGGDIIVRYKGQPGDMKVMGRRRTIGALAESHNLALLPVGLNDSIDEVIQELLDDPNVEYAEPNYEFYSQENLSPPNDPEISNQWALEEVTVLEAWSEAFSILEREDMPPASVTVAVVDTGVDSEHKDLKRVLPGYNAISGAEDRDDSSDDSRNGHGTHVAGIIAAETNNEVGIASITGEFPVNILPVKVLDSAGVGSMYDVAQGIYWAANNGAQVINLSLGARLPDYPKTLADAVKYAQDRGILVVAAAGNDGGEVDGFYPACLPGVLAVGASGRDHHRALFSNWGALVVAPGIDILSTLPNNHYGELSGTSQAAAFASGTAALLWAVLPEKSAGEVAESIREGRGRYSDNSGYHYVLSAYQALIQLDYHNTAPGPYGLTFINPSWDYGQHGTRVQGTVDLIVGVSNPAQVSRVDFTLYSEATEETSILTSVSQSQIDQSGLITYSWDTTKVADGMYKVEAYSYDEKESVLASEYVYVIVANNQENGLVIEVKKPDGSVAAGAWVTVQHAYLDPDTGEIVYEKLWNDSADLKGQVIIPGTKATAGNDFLVTAQGTDPDFFYYRLVHAPGSVVLDNSDAETITVLCQPEDQEPLAKAIVFLQLLEANLPESSEPTRAVKLDHYDNNLEIVPAATLGAAGTAEVTLTRGRYNLRLLSAEHYYNLIRKDIEIKEGTAVFDFLTGGTASLMLNPDGEFINYGLLLQNEDREAFTGFDKVEGGQLITVSPGTYTAQIEATCLDAGNNRELVWTLGVPSFQLKAGENNHLITFGKEISADIKNNLRDYQGYWPLGRMANFDTPFPDAHGNLTVNLESQPVSAAGSSGSSAWDSSMLFKVPDHTYVYNAVARRFELIEQARTEISPVLHIEDSTGKTTEKGMRRASYKHFQEEYASSWWSIPSDIITPEQNSAKFKAWVELDAGVLAPAGSDGIVASEKLEFEVRRPDPYIPPEDIPDLIVELKDGTGNGMESARVVLVRKVASGEYSETCLDYVAGEVCYYELTPGDYAAMVYGESPNPKEPDDGLLPLFMFKTFHFEAAPLTITLDASQLNLNKVTLQALDENGIPLSEASDTPYLHYYAYGYDSDGVPAGMWLEYRNPYRGSIDHTMLVPEGEYLFRVCAVESYGWDTHPYYITEKKSITNDGMVTLGGTGLQSLTIEVPDESVSYQPIYDIGGLALFGNGVPTAPVLRPRLDFDENTETPSATVYVTPDTYTGVGVLIHYHYDGDWNYWLQHELDLNSGPVTWPMNDNFDGKFSINSTTFDLGDAVVTTHSFRDGFHNRLIATGIDNVYGSSLADGSPVKGQNHMLIAPLLSINSPDGEQLLRYKAEDPGITQGWNDVGAQSGNQRPAQAAKPSGEGTYYGGVFTIPGDAVGGTYTAKLEFSAGPDVVINQQTTFEVLAAPGVTLDPLSSPTNSKAVIVSGTTVPEAVVEVKYTFGASTVAVGTVTADNKGRFSFGGVSLLEEGTYIFTALATLSGLTGKESAPVNVVVDRTPPESPGNLTGEAQDQSHIRLTWSAPAASDVAGYRIYRDQQLIAEVIDKDILDYLDGGLAEATDYVYSVTAIDYAGNESEEPSAVTVRTTTTGDTVPPTAPTSLTATSSPGKVELVWAAATDNIGVAKYRLYRAVGNNPEELLAEVEGLSYTDTGLEAETAYTYTVTAVDAAGNESPHSPSATATTPAINIISVAYRIERDRNGYIKPDNRVEVTITGDSGRQAKAVITCLAWFDAAGNAVDEVQDVELEVDMAEDQTLFGIYRGSLTIPTGVAGLKAITGILQDGSGHESRRETVLDPIVSSYGNLVVSIAEGGEYLEGSRLEVWSDVKQSGASVIIGAEKTYYLTGLVPNGDYRLRIVNQGLLLFSQPDVLVRPGMDSSVSVLPSQPASLTVKVADEEGAVEGVTFSLSVDDYTVMGKSGQDGVVRTWGSEKVILPVALEGSVITTCPVFSGDQNWRYYYSKEVVTLQAGKNDFTFHLQQRPTGVLKGRLVYENGDPVADAYVAASTKINDRSVTFSAVTDDNGEYFLEVPEQQYQVTASSRLTRIDTKTANVAANQNTTLDFTLMYNSAVRMAVFTKMLGEDEERPLEMHWRVAVHFHFTVRNVTKGKSWSNVNQCYPFVLINNSEPGDEIEITLDGREAGMTSQTVTVILDENRSGKAEFHLKEFGKIRARVQDEYRNLHKGVERTVEVYRQDGGQLTYAGGLFTKCEDSSYVDYAQRLAAGSYTVVYTWGRFAHTWDSHQDRMNGGHWWETERYQEGVDYVIFRDVVVEDGELTDLGDVVLPRDTSISDGYFAGKEGNGITANVTAAAPGRVVTLRAGYKYEGTLGRPVPRDVMLYLGIPAGATLVKDSVAVRSAEGLPEPSYSVNANENRVEVAIGDAVFDHGAAEGTVSYQVKLSEQPDWPTAAAKAWVEYRASAVSKNETLGTAIIEVPYVSINAPEKTAFEEITVNGHAPAGADVDIFAGGIYLGRATASPYGLWKQKVMLPDDGKPAWHVLTAQVAVENDTDLLVSNPAKVLYDSRTAVVEKVTMRQDDGRVISFDPREGVARFPYVFDPLYKFNFQLDFSKGVNVSDVKVLLKNRSDTTTFEGRRNSDSTFIAEGVVLKANPGDIYLQYEIDPPGYQATAMPDEKVLRAAMPSDWRFADITVAAGEEVDLITAQDTGYASTPPVNITLSDNGKQQHNVTFSVRELPTFTPNPQVLPISVKNGPTAYNYKFDFDIKPDKMRLEITAVVEASALEPYLGATGQSFKAQVGSYVELKIIDDCPIKSGLGVADLYDTIKSGFDFKETMDELNNFLDNTSSCSAGKIKYYHDKADQMANRAMQNLIAKYVMQLGGIALGATGIGVVGTVAIWGVSSILSEVAAAKWDTDFDNLKRELANDDECEKEEDSDDGYNDGGDDDGDSHGNGRRSGRKGGTPAASPSWIYDPSGYVYEVVEDNRVEGVTATAMYYDEGADSWLVWDAEWYEQINPQTTDAKGRYGWDVPKGLWKVVYEKEGYEPAQSWEMQVPPPHMDVNVGLISKTAPEVTAVSGALDEIKLVFSKYMRVNTIASSTVAVSVYGQVDEFGHPVYVAGSIEPVELQEDPKSPEIQLARTFRFLPDALLAPGGEYGIWVSQMVQSYAEQIMEQDFNKIIPVSGEQGDTVAPAPVANAKIKVGDGRLIITWSDPKDEDLSKVIVRWRVASGGSYDALIEVGKGAQRQVITGLTNGITYEVSLTAVDASGNESKVVVVSGTPKESDQPDPPKPPSDGGGGRDRKETPPPSLPSDEEQFEVGSSAQTISAFAGDISLEIPAGSFKTGATLIIRKVAAAVSNSAVGIFGPVYEITASDAAPSKALQLSIRYDAAAVQALDLRKLGLYKVGAASPANWVYVGGILNSAEGTLSTHINSFGQYAIGADTRTFADLRAHWSRENIEVLVSRAIVNGINDQQFEPDRSITRAEMTKLLVEVLNTAQGKCLQSTAATTSLFKDVSSAAWYHPYVETGAKYGIVKGSDGYFRPNEPVTREELAAMILRTMGVDANMLFTGQLPYSDTHKVSAWALPSVSLAHGLGLMQGSEGTFEPKSNATRAQVATVVLRAMERMGLISANTSLKGVVGISEIEGRHFELSEGKNTYVLVPKGEAIAAQLEAFVGKETEVTGELQQGVSSYMRGPVLEVFWVDGKAKLPGG